MLGSGCVKKAVVLAPSPVVPVHELSKTIVSPKTVILSFDADMTPSMRARLMTGKVKAWYDPVIIDMFIQDHVPARIFVTGLFAEVYPDLIRQLREMHLTLSLITS